MINFVDKLQKEIKQQIGQIEAGDQNILKKSLDASHILGEAFDRLKEFIIAYNFSDEAEEIEFFKETKPRLFCKLIYYRKLYNIEMSRPVASVEVQREHLKDELDAINKYTNKRLDFIRYYRSGANYLDRLYFLRGQTDTEQYLETFYYELDPQFSTNCDFKVARIMANDMLQAYLLSELEALDSYMQNPCASSFPKAKLTWMGTKAELNEQLFAWDSKGTFGNVPLTQLAAYIQNVFNIEMDHNLSRTFSEMRIRNTPTPFLDSMKEALLKRMRHGKRKKDKDEK